MGDTFVFVRGVGMWRCATLKVARSMARRLSLRYVDSSAAVVWCGAHFSSWVRGKEQR